MPIRLTKTLALNREDSSTVLEGCKHGITYDSAREELSVQGMTSNLERMIALSAIVSLMDARGTKATGFIKMSEDGFAFDKLDSMNAAEAIADVGLNFKGAAYLPPRRGR